MSVETIVLSIGVVISLALGIVNLLSRREKVVIVNTEVYPEFLPKGTWLHRQDGESIYLTCAELSMEATCELVLTSGQKEIEVKEVEVIFNKKSYETLKRYFNVPFRNRLGLYNLDVFEEKDAPLPILLKPKRTLYFKRTLPFNCTEEFEKEYEEMEKSSYPEFIQSILSELETKYQICWTRYDGKKLCWRFPNSWWRNLGKKLWG